MRDINALHPRLQQKAKQLKKDIDPVPCIMKNRRDTEMDSYNSDIDKCKLYYSLKNLASHGFYIEHIKHNFISICLFDSNDSIYTKKLNLKKCPQASLIKLGLLDKPRLSS